MISAKELYLRELCSEYESLLNRFRAKDPGAKSGMENLAVRLRLYGIQADPDDEDDRAVRRWLEEHPAEE